jgi:hypothetical protein
MCKWVKGRTQTFPDIALIIQRLTTVISPWIIAAMRRLLPIALAVAAGCQQPPPAPPPEPPRALASMLELGDPDSATQLGTGFYNIEWGNGRWTRQSFSVMLKAPRTAKERGAVLRAKIDLPKALIDQEQKVTLGCTVAGKGLPEETWDTPGGHLFSHDVPALTADPVPVSCKVDKRFIAPGDSRELGLVLHVIGLEPN